MTFKLKIECVQGAYLTHECIRVIAMDDGASLLDLHEAIQSAVSFGRDHPFEFYTANNALLGAERHWIAPAGDWEEKEAVFHAIRLRDIWPLGRKKLYYWFDLGDRWIFEIRKMRSGRADESISCPRVLERIGPDPEQYPRGQ